MNNNMAKNKLLLTVFFLLICLIVVVAVLAENKPASGQGAAARLDRPNTHLQLGCDTCHPEEPGSATRPEDALLIQGVDNSAQLCNQCHSDFNLHPVMFSPAVVAPEMLIPAVFPLGSRGRAKGKIVCITCHDVHQEGAANLLLRGLPGQPGQSSRFKVRLDMCKACHGEALAEKNPHNQSDKNCQYCHLTDPTLITEEKSAVRSDFLKLCLFCHEKTDPRHYQQVNPFADEKLRELIPSLTLPLDEGKTTCITCHAPHGESKEPHFLRKGFVVFAEKSRKINPHDSGSYCLSCHNIDPRTTPQITYRFDGNFVKVCKWCHATADLTADIHPVNIRPDKIKVNEKMFPLQNGKISCITCHDHRCQTKDITEDARTLNPKFLRGGPYANRSEMCYKCHPKNPRFDAHDQINDEGELVMKTCLYCHTSDPTLTDEATSWQQKTLYTTKMTYLCTRCHQDSPHPASFFHVTTPPDNIRKNLAIYEIENSISLPLDEAGNVTCVTCHNPHERGALQDKADSYGADEENRLRLKFICIACHSGQAGTEGLK